VSAESTGDDTFGNYANVTGRPTGALIRALARVHRGIATVAAQDEPYARAWRSANQDAVRRPGPRWIVFGDSMSQGIGASRFDAGWINQLDRRLIESGLSRPIVNLSASGARVDDVLGQQLPAWRALPAASGDGTDLITVLLGSNDLLSKPHRRRLPQAFAELVAQLPHGAVVSTLPQPRTAAREVNIVLAAASARGEITVVDMRAAGPSSWRGRLAADHFHPNDRGYAGIAAAFYPLVLRTLLPAA
jgi:lysophospholipase L1-like esterase